MGLVSEGGGGCCCEVMVVEGGGNEGGSGKGGGWLSILEASGDPLSLRVVVTAWSVDQYENLLILTNNGKPR